MKFLASRQKTLEGVDVLEKTEKNHKSKVMTFYIKQPVGSERLINNDLQNKSNPSCS